MSLATWHFHIEISSKCTLKCPRCARQEVPDSLVNTELNLEFFKRNFTPKFILDNIEKITFCGDDGDPIYAHDLIPVIQYIKSIKPVEIVIITNGSYKKPEWWVELGQSLGSYDSIHFSVDGYDNYSNNQYRINSDFDSIVEGIKALRKSSECQIIWAAIAFSFNQDHLDEMQQLARNLGVDKFQLTRSTKFGSVYNYYGTNDTLEPRQELVSNSHRFERDIILFSEPSLWQTINLTNLKLYNQTHNKAPIRPLCAIGNKGLYIDARGRLFPCCWVANRYSHNNEWQTLANQFDLNTRTLEQVLADEFWSTEFQTFKWQECQTKCRSDLVTEKYATEW